MSRPFHVRAAAALLLLAVAAPVQGAVPPAPKVRGAETVQAYAEPSDSLPPMSREAAPSGKPASDHPMHAANAAIVEQFLTLAYGPDPGSGIPARETLTRFSGEMRAYVSGDEADRRAVEATLTNLSRLTTVPMELVAGGQPNLFVAVTQEPVESFRGPLRQLLLLALSADEDDVEAFLAAVVAAQPCWILPVWADPSRTLIKAAVIGVDARIGRGGIERCILRKLAGSLGLLGAEDTLPRSVFNPASRAIRLSYEDQLMIRLLYDRDLPAGLDLSRSRSAINPALQKLRSH